MNNEGRKEMKEGTKGWRDEGVQECRNEGMKE